MGDGGQAVGGVPHRGLGQGVTVGQAEGGLGVVVGPGPLGRGRVRAGPCGR